MRLLGYCIITILTLWQSTAVASDAKKLNVAVMQFEVKGDLGIQDGGAIISEWMVSGLSKTGKYTLYERVLLAKVVEEQELQNSHLVDEKKMAAEIGRLYGVDAIVGGTVLKWGKTVSIVARMINTNTGIILNTAEIKTQDVDNIPVEIDALARQLAGQVKKGVVQEGQPQGPSKATLSLTVQTTPANAKVRVLNIKPKYYDGIELAPGSYHVEVSKGGYQTQRVWVELKQDKHVEPIVLAKGQSMQAPSTGANLAGVYQLTVYQEDGVTMSVSAQMELQLKRRNEYQFHSIFQVYNAMGQLVNINYYGLIWQKNGRWMIRISDTDQPDWVDYGDAEMALESEAALLGMSYTYGGSHVAMIWAR